MLTIEKTAFIDPELLVVDDNEFDELSLSELFAASDAIGDKYLSAEEIADRENSLAALRG